MPAPSLMRREIQALPSSLSPVCMCSHTLCVCVVMMDAVHFVQCFQMQRRMSELGVKEKFCGSLIQRSCFKDLHALKYGKQAVLRASFGVTDPPHLCCLVSMVHSCSDLEILPQGLDTILSSSSFQQNVYFC